jgi:hypothetical protein
MAFTNTYFDFKNFTEPIQTYLDGQFFWDLMPGFRKKTDIYYKKNEASLTDSLVQVIGSSDHEFFQIQNSREQTEIEGSDLQFASVYLRFDSEFDQYDRRVYSFGDLLGQVGGIYESMLIIGMLFVGIFSERLFISSILNKIYQIDLLREQEIQDVKNKVTPEDKGRHPLQKLATTAIQTMHEMKHEKDADLENKLSKIVAS